jgi:hypothetical protein
MPRITINQQYRRYSLLRLLWIDAPKIYSLLRPAQQWELHEFYQSSRHVDFDEFELHISNLQTSSPSLCSRAGKHFRVLETAYLKLRSQGVDLSDQIAFSQALTPRLIESGTATIGQVKSNRTTKPRHISVTSVARPEPNLRLLARAYLGMAEQTSSLQKDDTHASEPDAS